MTKETPEEYEQRHIVEHKLQAKEREEEVEYNLCLTLAADLVGTLIVKTTECGDIEGLYSSATYFL